MSIITQVIVSIDEDAVREALGKLAKQHVEQSKGLLFESVERVILYENDDDYQVIVNVTD